MTQKTPIDTDRLALERTHLAAERTFLAVLRTGLSIAGAGTVIVAILGESWPEWLSVSLAAVFIILGYSMIIITLEKYQKTYKRLKIEPELNVMSPRHAVVLALALQVALGIVLLLFLFGLFKT
jgi:uncharacterized membrane protein YidH (DUF202 family)